MAQVSIKAVFQEQKDPVFPGNLTREAVKPVRQLHESMNGYAKTPLHSLPGLARCLGIKNILVKDESHRFGLNAFKSLGAAWAMVRIMAEKLGKNQENQDFSFFQQSGVREKIRDLVFVTATDGNHGRGMAWAAKILGCKAVVYMPAGTVAIRVKNIENQGAKVIVTNCNYDDSVRLAAQAAKENNWHLVQDTAMEGYEKVPAWILQGYTTMAAEALEQVEEKGHDLPTHLFLQAGVGSMPAAVLGYYANVFKKLCPATYIMEPDKADCMYRSALAGDGRPRTVTGALDTMMAGLACGEPNPFAWKILRDFSAGFFSCADQVAARGMQLLARPNPGDPGIVSGESGAVGIGLIHYIMTDPVFVRFKEKMNLGPGSTLLCFSTEGDTDPDNYQKIVHQG